VGIGVAVASGAGVDVGTTSGIVASSREHPNVTNSRIPVKSKIHCFFIINILASV
jgi:hypothetical protein